MSNSPHAGYRPDVDGLRAVAVLSVLAFHAFPRSLPGGFVGVDIFFVISGYLISGIIFRAIQANRFSYRDFYSRRIKRIFPALLTVLSAALIAGWFLLLPDELKAIGKQTLGGALFVANLLFWSESGYFDVSSQLKPLLHLWSLGVEEQFYLSWPLIVAWFYRSRTVFAATMVLLFCASLALGIHQTFSDPTAAFYSPLTRFWELLLGAWLADRELRLGLAGTPGAPVTWQRNGLALLGSALLAASLVALAESRDFPGYWALMPTLGALFLIASPGAWVNRVILSNRVLVGIGLISYPLYLWHWVLLAFVRTRLYVDGGEAPRNERVAVVALSFLLAWLTYVLVEKPLRFNLRSRWVPVGLAAGMVVVAAAGAAAYQSDGGAFRYPSGIRALAGYQFDAERNTNEHLYRAESCFIDEGREIGGLPPECVDREPAQGPLLALWGDSHAASLYPGLRNLQESGQPAFRVAQFNHSGCPPIASLGAPSRESCRNFNAGALERLAQLKPDIVVLEGHWWFYRNSAGNGNHVGGEDLRRTVRRLQELGIGRVVVFGNLPVWRIYQPKVVVKRWRDSGAQDERTYDYFEKDSLDIDDEVRAAIDGTGAEFFSPVQHLCNEAGCLLTAKPGQWLPVAWDGAHLSREGSDLVIGLAQKTIFGSP